jgi:hypothetical protein
MSSLQSFFELIAGQTHPNAYRLRPASRAARMLPLADCIGIGIIPILGSSLPSSYVGQLIHKVA